MRTLCIIKNKKESVEFIKLMKEKFNYPTSIFDCKTIDVNMEILEEIFKKNNYKKNSIENSLIILKNIEYYYSNLKKNEYPITKQIQKILSGDLSKYGKGNSKVNLSNVCVIGFKKLNEKSYKTNQMGFKKGEQKNEMLLSEELKKDFDYFIESEKYFNRENILEVKNDGIDIIE